MRSHAPNVTKRWHFVAGVSLLGSSVAFAFVGVTGTQYSATEENSALCGLRSQTVSYEGVEHAKKLSICWCFHPSMFVSLISPRKADFKTETTMALYQAMRATPDHLPKERPKWKELPQVYDFGRICNIFFKGISMFVCFFQALWLETPPLPQRYKLHSLRVDM